MPKTDELIQNIDRLLLDPARRDTEPEAGQVGHTRMFSNIKSVDESNRTIDFVCSDATLDRYGEIVLPSAFANLIDAFMRNPVFPFGHFYEAQGQSLPTVGHWRSMRVADNALVGTAWFKPRGLGEEAWRDYIEGNLTSVSVAFLTKAWEMRQMKVDGQDQRVRVFTEVDLLEVSAVLIPANPSARIRAAAHAATAGDDSQEILKKLESFLTRIERQLSTNGTDGPKRGSRQGEAEGTRGRDDASFVEAYFGDTPDVDEEPAPRSASTGDEIELKSALRDVLGG